MDKPSSAMAEEIARAAMTFEQQRTGHTPKSITVVLSNDTLVIILRGGLSEAEKVMASSPTGAAQMQEFHRELFANASHEFRQEIKRITGVKVREATAEIETGVGAVTNVFATGTVVQVFLLKDCLAEATWSNHRPDREKVVKEPNGG